MNQTTCVIVGQNMPDVHSDAAVDNHGRTFIFEPLEDAYSACLSRYWGRATVIPKACGAEAGIASFNRYNVRGLSSSMGTVSAEMAERYSNFDFTLQETTTVEVVNLYNWLKHYGVESIDNLSIDAQGMDLTILKTLEPMIAASKIDYIMAEADGDGVKLYDGLPDNSVEGFMEFMGKFPQYKFAKIPNRVSFNPDLSWELI
jgi:FkbM family methyltransferase